MRNFVLKLGLAAVATSFTGPAAAATTTTTFQVDATVISTCSVSAADLAFGTYDPLAAQPVDTQTTVTVQCTLTTGYTVALSPGAGAGATVAARKMTRGLTTDTLGYSLYQDTTRAQVWGETGADLVSGTGTGVAQDHDVYGRIPAGQNVNPGGYSDTITVTVTF
jgi:spore coat protein U-like protein